MPRGIRLITLVIALIVSIRCSKTEGIAKEETKKEFVEINSGKNVGPGDKNKDGDSSAKSKGGDATVTNISDPFKPKGFDPKIAEQKKAEETKQSTLAQLCRDAFSEVKETRRAAFNQLEKDYPKLEPHVRTLTRDTDPAELEKAFKAIAEMGPRVQGAWVAIEKGMGRAFASEDYRISGVISAGIDGFVKIAPGESGVVKKLIELAQVPDVPAQGKAPAKDRSGIRAAAVTALGQVAPVNALDRQREIIQALKKACGDAKNSAALPATKALGEVAKSSPLVRTDVDSALQGALANPTVDVRHAAVEALFHCGARVSEKTKTILDDLKDDKEKKVRDAVTITFKEITRQYVVVSQLDKVGIVEGKLPLPLYQASFALVEGARPEDAVKVLRNAAHDADAWQTLTGLTRIEKDAAVRKTALTILGQWAKPEENFRKMLVPVFLSAMKDKETADVGKTGLVRCGVETVRQLKAAKTDIDLVALFRGQGDDSDPYVGLGVCEGLGEFRLTAKKDLEPLFYHLEFTKEPLVTRAAAKALLHLGPEQMEHADTLNSAYVKMNDEKAAKDVAKIIENMGLKAGAGAFLSSQLLHPKVDGARKKMIIDNLQFRRDKFNSKEPPNLAAFGREADPKAKEMVIDRWLDDMKPMFVKDRYGTSAPARIYSREVLLLCKYFGADAKKLAPLLTEDLLGYGKSFKVTFTPHVVAEALGYIGPVPGVDSRKALELASRVRPLGSRQFEDQVMAAAKRALGSFPGESVETPVPITGLSKEEKAAGFELLFNGKDFTGWSRFESNYKEQRSVHFDITEGSLHTMPQRPKTGGRIAAIGSLYSDGTYKNFVLRFDVLVTEGTNCTLCFRCPEQGYGPQTGIAVEIIDNAKFKGYKRKFGSLYNVDEATIEEVSTEKWHAMEIHADGPLIQVKHNGQVISKADLRLSKQAGARRTEGHFVLISQGGRAEFRNMRIKKLP